MDQKETKSPDQLLNCWSKTKYIGPTGPKGRMAEGWTRVAEGQTELFEQSEKSEGPSRPASPETARPARRAGQPQKIEINTVELL